MMEPNVNPDETNLKNVKNEEPDASVVGRFTKMLSKEQLMKAKDTGLSAAASTFNSAKEKSIETYNMTRESLQNNEKIMNTVEFVQTKGTAAAGYVMEKSEGLRANASKAWQQSKVSVHRVREKVAHAAAWRGSAKDTLGNLKDDEFKNLKVQGAEELPIGARTKHTQVCVVKPGMSLRWIFRVKDYNIGFGVSMRIQVYGGSKEEEVLPIENYDSEETVRGSWSNESSETKSMVLIFDNSYSKLRSKTVAYVVGTEQMQETPSETLLGERDEDSVTAAIITDPVAETNSVTPSMPSPTVRESPRKKEPAIV